MRYTSYQLKLLGEALETVQAARGHSPASVAQQQDLSAQSSALVNEPQTKVKRQLKPPPSSLIEKAAERAVNKSRPREEEVTESPGLGGRLLGAASKIKAKLLGEDGVSKESPLQMSPRSDEFFPRLPWQDEPVGSNSQIASVVDMAGRDRALGQINVTDFFAQIPFDEPAGEAKASSTLASRISTAPADVPTQGFFAGLPWQGVKSDAVVASSAPSNIAETAGSFFAAMPWDAAIAKAVAQRDEANQQEIVVGDETSSPGSTTSDVALDTSIGQHKSSAFFADLPWTGPLPTSDDVPMLTDEDCAQLFSFENAQNAKAESSKSDISTRTQKFFSALPWDLSDVQAVAADHNDSEELPTLDQTVLDQVIEPAVRPAKKAGAFFAEIPWRQDQLGSTESAGSEPFDSMTAADFNDMATNTALGRARANSLT